MKRCRTVAFESRFCWSKMFSISNLDYFSWLVASSCWANFLTCFFIVPPNSRTREIWLTIRSLTRNAWLWTRRRRQCFTSSSALTFRRGSRKFFSISFGGRSWCSRLWSLRHWCVCSTRPHCEPVVVLNCWNIIFIIFQLLAKQKTKKHFPHLTDSEKVTVTLKKNTIVATQSKCHH